MELLQLEVQLLREQLALTGKFLPESFFSHGGDNDGLQIMLHFPNMLQKITLLSNQIKAKVSFSQSFWIYAIKLAIKIVSITYLKNFAKFAIEFVQ